MHVPIFYTVPEAAAILRIGRTTFYKLLANGEINAAKRGRMTLIPAIEVTAFAERLIAEAQSRKPAAELGGRDE